MRVRATFAALALLFNVALCARLPLSNAIRQDNHYLRALARQAEEQGAPRVPPEFNINSGGPAVGRFIAEEKEWIVGDTNVFALEDVVIGGAEEKNLPMYKSHRFGVNGVPWGYDIPVMEPGTYGCTVHFAEIHSEAFVDGARVFDLYMATSHGEAAAFKDIDIFKELGGAEFTVLTKTAVDLVIPGVLSIRVSPSAGDAIISGITCERTGDLPAGVEPDYLADPNIPTEAVGDTDPTDEPSGGSGAVITGTEININVGGPAVGRFLAEDYSWIRGPTSFWGGPEGVQIGGAEDKNRPALISHRYGVDGATWGYVIPVEMPGQYHCSLHFAETDSESFKVGARVFNIMLQDRTEDNVDAFKDSGEAPFTSVVKTFLNVSIGNELFIGLTAVNGDAFLSAITCERIGDLVGIPPGSSPDPLFDESPTPEETTSDPLEPAPTSTPTASTPPSETPTVESPEASPVDATPASSDIPTTEIPSPSPAASDEVIGDPDEPVQTDAPLDRRPGEEEKLYELLAKVSGGGVFTVDMKDTLKVVSEGAGSMDSRWAVTNIDPELPSGTSRQETDTRNYRVNLQAMYKEKEYDEAVGVFTDFVEDGEMNNELRTRGQGELDISFRSPPAQSKEEGPDTASTGTTSTVVGGAIGGVLALLAIVALAVFFVVRRNRSGDPNSAGFDGPPPAMTESEMSSVMERAESVNSIEYHDDDSTFTAATSRAGEHVDQVAFDKDVFGRGTAAGAHGTS